MKRETAEAQFQTMYEAGAPPWVIGHPQPAVVELEAKGLIEGRVLDVGTGTGEHTILLSRLGYDVVGVDLAPLAVEQASVRAAEENVAARFEVVDVLAEPGVQALGQFDTVLDSALFHNLDGEDRARYQQVLAQILRPGGLLLILALARGGKLGPEIDGEEIEDAFGGVDWSVPEISANHYSGRVRGQAAADRLGLPIGSEVVVPAWTAAIRRTGSADRTVNHALRDEAH